MSIKYLEYLLRSLDSPPEFVAHFLAYKRVNFYKICPLDGWNQVGAPVRASLEPSSSHVVTASVRN